MILVNPPTADLAASASETNHEGSSEPNQNKGHSS
jgi:hypothetical protein